MSSGAETERVEDSGFLVHGSGPINSSPNVFKYIHLLC